MTTYPEDIMRAAFEWTAKSYNKDTETWLDVRDNFAAAIMAERQRCYDLAHEVCENDFDHVTGELDNDIMNGVTLADKEAEFAAKKAAIQSQDRLDETNRVFSVSLTSQAFKRRLEYAAKLYEAMHLNYKDHGIIATFETEDGKRLNVHSSTLRFDGAKNEPPTVLREVDETLNPKFDEAGKVHDWRNHVGERTQAIWATLTNEQRSAIKADAQEKADAEEWD